MQPQTRVVLDAGTSAVRQDAQMYTSDPAEASLNRAMLERCSQVIVLANSSKFSSGATYAVASVDSAHHLITDSRLSPDWQKRLSEAEINMIVIPLESSNGGKKR